MHVHVRINSILVDQLRFLHLLRCKNVVVEHLNWRFFNLNEILPLVLDRLWRTDFSNGSGMGHRGVRVDCTTNGTICLVGLRGSPADLQKFLITYLATVWLL